MTQKLAFLLFVLLATTSAFAQLPTEYQWTKTFASSTGGSNIVKLKKDNYGSIYVLGRIGQSDSVDVDLTSASIYLKNGTGGNESAYVAQYNDQGELYWYFVIQSAAGSAVTPQDFAIDPFTGSIYVVGTYIGDANIINPYGTGLPASLLTSVASDGFIIRVHPYDIGAQWANTTSNVSGNSCLFSSVAVNEASSSNNVYLGGYFVGNSVDVDPGTANSSLSSNSASEDAFLCSLDASTGGIANGGSALHTFGSAQIEHLTQITAYDDNNVYFVGDYGDKVLNINTDVSSNDSLTHRGGVGFDAFVGKYAFNGSFSHINYIKSIGGTDNDVIKDMLLTNNNTQLVLVGNYLSPTLELNLDATPVTLSSSDGIDGFVAVYNAGALNSLGTAKFTGVSNTEQYVNTVAEYNTDTLLVGGMFFGGVNVGSMSATSVGGYDGFWSMIKTDGTILTLNNVGSNSSNIEDIRHVLVSDAQDIMMCGTFADATDFDVSTNGFDVFSTSVPTNFITTYGIPLPADIDNYSSGDPDDEANAISVDKDGDVFVTGVFTSNVGALGLSGANGESGFLERRDDKGNLKWAIALDSVGTDIGTAVMADDTTIYVATKRGATGATITQRINKNTGSVIWTQRTNPNGNVGAIDADNEFIYQTGDSSGVAVTRQINKNTGTTVWSQRKANTKGTCVVSGISHVYSTSDSSGTTITQRINKNTGGVVWSQRTIGTTKAVDAIDIYLYTIGDSAGTIVLRQINKNTATTVWSQRVATGSAGGVSISQGNGNVYIAGSFTGTSSYLGKTSAGGTDAFVARINKNTGGVVWSQRGGGPGNDSLNSIKAENGNIIHLVGNTDGGSFGTGLTASNAGILIVRMSADSLESASTYIRPTEIQVDAFAVKVYPNPTYDMVNLFSQWEKPQVVQLRLVDLMGRVVYQERLMPQTQLNTQVDVGELPHGIYLLQVETEGKTVVRKIIKE